MSKLINCLRMIELLQARGKMKIRELAEELEVKERMIQLYKNNLEKAGIMIESTQGRNGGYSISKHTMFPVKNLSLEELEALGFAVDHIRSKGSKVHSSNLKQAMDKLKAVKKMEDDYDKHVYFVNRSIPNNEVLNENHKYIKLLSALHNKRKVKITYHTVSTGEIKERIISPYAFVHYNEFFYCIAMCDLKKEYRIFKLLHVHQF
ncbi:WYL domain-containing protein [Bacillus sp. DX4.1]|uniref:helix-turn-helix transcriptional regulator n=1 Tax=Bacillus sp. DX4.1 TaxID=3055867 RepID=UPI0025A1493E|nr:WYL domain-containing protein [Bacillus sp. DX4.1]MDM5188882.1 WYL domain-containing protein [Bacillus sp. DX4.1]